MWRIYTAMASFFTLRTHLLYSKVLDCIYFGLRNSTISSNTRSASMWNRYHIPRERLSEKGDNLLVLFEEMGGDPSSITFATRSQSTVCGHVSESHSTPVSKWIQSVTKSNKNTQDVPLPEVRLECAAGKHISQILFASFGNSTGNCGAFEQGGCHASVSIALTEKVN
jgi:hypothetical protein